MSPEQPTQSDQGVPASKTASEERPSSPFARFRPEPPPSYSTLLKEINSGSVKDLVLIPGRREVIATFSDGRKVTVPILANDQQILRVAEASGTPLNVKDVRQEQALAGLAGNFALVALIVIGLSLLLRRSAQMANKTMGFGRSQPRTSASRRGQCAIRGCGRYWRSQGRTSGSGDLPQAARNIHQVGCAHPQRSAAYWSSRDGENSSLAKAIAGEAGVPFFSIAASEFVELFVGVGASRVRDLFRQAKEKSPALFSLMRLMPWAGQRGAGIGGGNDEREQTLNQLLTEMDGFADNSGVILLAATNRADVLDTALMRPGRFDRRIQVGLPDRRGREAILSVHARTRPLSDDVSLADWARRTPGFSGADLANLLNEAAILTARHEVSFLGNRQLEEALERITMGLTAAPLQDGAKKRLIAYHEIGHALVAALTPHADPVDKVTLLPRSGGVGGFTRFFPDEEIIDSGLVTRAYLQARLVMALGGRAAEIVVFGDSEVTQGASGDLQMVTQLAREMVTRFGFSDLGPVALEGQDQEVFLGRDLMQTRQAYAESTGREIDRRIRELACQSLQQAIALLTPRRELMDRLVEALIEEETLQSDRFHALAGIDATADRPSLDQLPAKA